MAPAIMQHDKGVDNDDDSVAVIENAMKQIAFASNRDRVCLVPQSRPITIQQQPQLELRIDDRHGGPDFKAQTDSRSMLAVEPIVAKPSGPNDDDADFCGRVAPAAGRCQISRYASSQVVLVAAIPEQQQQRRSKVRKEHTPSSSKRTKTTKQKKRSIYQSPKKFWLALLSVGIFLNMILAAGVTTAFLYFTGSFENATADTTAPTMSPTGSWIAVETNTTALPGGIGEVSALPPQNQTAMESDFVDHLAPPDELSASPPSNFATAPSPTFQDMVSGRNSSVADEPGAGEPPIIPESEPPLSRRDVAVSIVSLVAILLEIGIVVGLRRVYWRWKTKMAPGDTATEEEEDKDSSDTVYF